MTPSSFELHMTLPGETRFVPALDDVVQHAAAYVGCGPAEASAFCGVVLGVVADCCRQASGRLLDVVVRREDGPLEVLVECEADLSALATSQGRTTITCTRAAGRSQCRIAHVLQDSR
ncbi:MAG: hypothetical protein HOP14_00345 [Acidobacteria bacterium]|nr:hypothetical protein [Acidobacteriota bacterium]